MKTSLNWAQYYSNVDLKAIPKDELLEKIGAQLGAVEEVVEWGPRFDGIVVARVVSCDKHDNADKLSVCRIDDGGAVQNVERGEDGLVQVVCGAPNVRPGLTVAWLPPGVTVPSTTTKDPFVLEARDIRGQKSNGMLASAAELGISDNHDGILEIEASDGDVGEENTKPGTPFKNLYGLDDLVIDIENKMFTHRPDCFGILGVARELAGIQGLAFKSPDWYQKPVENQQTSNLAFSSKNEIPELVTRFTAQVVEGVQIMQSPIWMQAGFARIGTKSINNIVDLTNYYMHLTAQPTHAFDYDKIKAVSGGTPTIFPRMAEEGEELKLLGGKTIKLTTDDMVIATDKQAVGLAGVMGGADTEVDANTKNIIIECATFDMYTIRRTSMRHGLFTDAVTRFNKGQSLRQNAVVLAKLVSDIRETTQAQAGALFDSNPEFTEKNYQSIGVDFVNQRLGLNLTVNDMRKLLKNVEFEFPDAIDEGLQVRPPFWRTDIEIPEDYVEEIGRLYGYDRLPVELPKRNIQPAQRNQLLEGKRHLRELLAQAGANEVLTYSFVHANLLDNVGQDKENAFQIANALSPDLQYYRMSLLPSLLALVHPNLKAGYSEFALFEIGKTHSKDLMEDGLPVEEERLSLVFASDDKSAEKQYSGAAYYQAQRYLSYILDGFGIKPVFEPATTHEPKLAVGKAAIAPFETSRAVYIKTEDGKLLGELGELKGSVRRALKLPSYSAGLELDIKQILASASRTSSYQPIPKFPKVEQDISLRVPTSLTYQDLYLALTQAITEQTPEHTDWSLEPLDIYQKTDDADHKQLSFRLRITSHDRTLVAQEVNSLLDAAAQKVQVQHGAERL